jgi:parallel beta-helix repeat protein
MLLFLSLRTVFSQTPVPGGNVSGTWTLAGTPYLINGEITIPFDSTLTIEPGIIVEFQGHYKLNVQGRLLAIGTETDTIVITVNDTTGFSNPDIPDGGWHGISFINTSSANDSSKIVYCKLQYGKDIGSSWPDNNGGAIRVYNFSKLLIDHCLFDRNIANSGDYPTGGAIQISDYSNIMVTNCTISRNSSINGGGIQITNATPSIINCTIINNHATEAGGGICCWDNGNPLIENVTLSGNTATFGGGVSFYNANPLLINNIIVNNQATAAGGILFNGISNAILINNTICNNYVSDGGGGIICGGDDSSPIIINTILYGNTAGWNNQVDFWDNPTPSFYYCDVEGGIGSFPGGFNIDADPLFKAVADSDYYLSDTSPCIGSGIDTLEINGNWFYAPTTDIEGNPRPNPPGSNPDVGAYENSIGHMGPNILITIDTLDFGYVYLGAPDSMELIVRNNGTEDLLISSALAEPNVFSVIPSVAGVDPLETEVFKVTFKPDEAGNYLGLLTLANNDPDSSNFHVALMGIGKEAAIAHPFTRITEGDIVNDGGNSLGTAWGDYDNDGYLDLFVTNGRLISEENNFLYRNNGDGTFIKITTGDIVNDVGNSSGAAWGDYNNDGYLDLFVANGWWIAEQDNFLYRNNSDGTFTKIITGDIVNDEGPSWGSSWGDYDNDGDLDLFVANGFWSFEHENFLYRNNSDGTFAKITCYKC